MTSLAYMLLWVWVWVPETEAAASGIVGKHWPHFPPGFYFETVFPQVVQDGLKLADLLPPLTSINGFALAFTSVTVTWVYERPRVDKHIRMLASLMNLCKRVRDVEMAQCLRALVLPKNQGYIPRPTWQLTTICNSSYQGFNDFF